MANIGKGEGDGETNNDGGNWSMVESSRNRNKEAGRGAEVPQEQSSHSDWSGPPVCIEPVPHTLSNSRFQPFMLLLVGLPGSGKSTFARALVEAINYLIL